MEVANRALLIGRVFVLLLEIEHPGYKELSFCRERIWTRGQEERRGRRN
jgi:hypothetical protein